MIPDRAESGELDVSVIIPVYNVEDYLPECLDSLVNQALGSFTAEVIAVDDGSTDASGSILDEYAGRYDFVRVIHQENSGWPGRPRNVGLDVARGRYTLFCDPDDFLGEESLRRMLTFADEFDVDVLLPKLVGVNGRYIRGSIYQETQVDADLFRASRSTNVVKLIRSRILQENDIRFDEGKVLMEDAMVVFRAMTHASRVSILADYDYYHVRLRDDRSNISFQPTDPYAYASSMTKVMSIVRDGFDDSDLATRINLEIFRRIGLNKYEGRVSRNRVTALVDAHWPVIDEFIPKGAELDLRFPARERLGLIRERRVEALLEMAELGDELELAAVLSSAESSPTELLLDFRLSVEGQSRRINNAILEVRSRDNQESLAVNCELIESIANGELSIAPSSVVHRARLNTAELLRPGMKYDFSVSVCLGGDVATARLRGSDIEGDAVKSAPGLFVTKWGNLSYKRASGDPAVQSKVTVRERLLRIDRKRLLRRARRLIGGNRE